MNRITRIARLATLTALAALGALGATAMTAAANPFSPGRFCTMEFGYLYHPVTGERTTYTNGCVKHELLQRGYTFASPVVTPDVEAGMETRVGTFQSVFAIGGESTGTALILPNGTIVELDLSTHGLDAFFAEGLRAKVEGHFVDVAGIEIPVRQVFVANAVTILH